MQQNKAPEAEPKCLCNCWRFAGANSGGSELWLRYRRSDPPSRTRCCHAFYSSKRDGGSGPCVRRLPRQSCIRSHRKPLRQGTGVLALCCNTVPLKNELLCLPRPKHSSYLLPPSIHPAHSSIHGVIPRHEGYQKPQGRATKTFCPFSASPGSARSPPTPSESPLGF